MNYCCVLFASTSMQADFAI